MGAACGVIDVLTAYDRRIDAEVLLHRTQATILDRGASLDDAGDRGGPTLGRLPEGISHERARCLRRHSDLTDTPDIRSLRGSSPTGHSECPHSGFTPPDTGVVSYLGY